MMDVENNISSDADTLADFRADESQYVMRRFELGIGQFLIK
jgi:hypothetical protein